MANMDVTQRDQIERAELGHARGDRLLSARGDRWPIAYTVIAGLVAIGLCIAAVSVIDSWAQWLVLAVIVMTTVGLIIAVSPTRRH
jgi:peptidoglycan/LPS O-acetylase OafA/YrhL